MAYQGGTIACTFYEDVPVVENDYLAVWGWATELTTYTTTNEYGVTKNHNAFLLEGRYYETYKTADKSESFTQEGSDFYLGHTYICETEKVSSETTQKYR